jgi:bacillithiol synthase
MQVHKRDLTTSLSPLLQAYFNGELPFAVTFQPDMNGLRNAMDAKAWSLDRRVELLKAWSIQYTDNHPRQQLLESIKQPTVFTVTTGHQLVLATGPAYCIYKIASTIALAKKCNAIWSDRKIIPVFWLASEDHDFAEINHLFGKAFQPVWKRPHGGPVGRLPVNGILEVLEQWLAWLQENNAGYLAQLIRESYTTGNLSDAFRTVIDHLFQHEDLLILDGDRPAFKSQWKSHLKKELLESPTIAAMQTSSKWIADRGFGQQITPREINLFYQSNDMRKRIVCKDDGWNVLDTEVKWNEKELLEELNNQPERFSPNVALRPIYQENILPNIAYVGGPGELQYWLQLKPVFDAFETEMPVVLLRDSALLVNRSSSKKWLKLGGDWKVFQSRFDSIQKDLVQQSSVDIAPTKKKIEAVMHDLKTELAALDQSLATAADMELNNQLKGLELLEKKMNKTIRQKEEVKIQQLQSLMADVRPNDIPQERHFNFLDLQAQMSADVMPMLTNAFDPLRREVTIILDVDPDRIEA